MTVYLTISHNKNKEAVKTAEKPNTLILHLHNDTTINMTWEESDIQYQKNQVLIRGKAVLFDDHYANGRLHEIKNNIQHVELITEEPADTSYHLHRMRITNEDDIWEYEV